MFSIQTLLVPIVFSPHGAWAARYAARLRQEWKSRLVFLHVKEIADATTLEEFLSAELGAVQHRSVMIEGDPAEEILECAEEYGADLILMPTYNVRFRPFLLGSVTAKILHDAQCPVLTGVHHYNAQTQIADPVPDTFRHLVCALDETPDCVSLVRWARACADSLHASLRFVHAIPAVNETSENCGEVEIRRYLCEQARQGFQARFAMEEVPPTVEIRGGKIAQVIREAALAEKADLVLVGRGHADRALGGLRTHTYNIIRNSPCPVISI